MIRHCSHYEVIIDIQINIGLSSFRISNNSYISTTFSQLKIALYLKKEKKRSEEQRGKIND